MKLAYRVFVVTLTLLAVTFAAIAQTTTTDNSKRSAKDDRNTAPTVGTGGPVGGPTGLFTVYDGQTLRKGEFTFSAAFSNYDRDPGNVDISEVPVSFQVGLSNYFEMFFNTDAYRGVKVNSPRNLSSFYLPNSRINGISPAAVILGPRGASAGPFRTRRSSVRQELNRSFNILILAATLEPLGFRHRSFRVRCSDFLQALMHRSAAHRPAAAVDPLTTSQVSVLFSEVFFRA